jgi:hypothetical protein
LGEDDDGTCPLRDRCLRYTLDEFRFDTAFASRLCVKDEAFIEARYDNVVEMKGYERKRER